MRGENPTNNERKTHQTKRGTLGGNEHAVVFFSLTPVEYVRTKKHRSTPWALPGDAMREAVFRSFRVYLLKLR